MSEATKDFDFEDALSGLARTGGAAFPGFHPHMPEGMTLRDYFAGQALTAISGNVGFPVLDGIEEHVASNAYTLADAMLKARGDQS